MDSKLAQALLDDVLTRARAAGADAADAILYSAVSAGVSWRMGALEDVERSEGRDLGLRVLVGKRQAMVSTTDLTPSALNDMVGRCAAMAKAAPEDPYCGLAPRERLARAPFADLDPGDFNEPDTQTLKRRAAECEAAALSVKGVVNSSGAGASYGEGRKWFATSDGFFGEAGGSRHSISVSVLAQDDNGMERDYDYDQRTHLGDMRAPEAVGLKAGALTVERLSPRKLSSRAAPVVFDKRLSHSLLGDLAGAVHGGAIARGVSFLKDKMGAKIFRKGINIIDDPQVKRGLGSRAFDGEGVASAPIRLIDDGVLTCWLMNSAHARQLKLETNGRATRGASGPPGAGVTNLWLESGAQRPLEMLRRLGDGLLVTDMFGPQVNPNTGDYSVGCSGFWFEGGERAYPVSEITIAGNLLDMFAAIEPANDLEFRGSVNAPTLFVGAMTIAGD